MDLRGVKIWQSLFKFLLNNVSSMTFELVSSRGDENRYEPQREWI